MARHHMLIGAVIALSASAVGAQPANPPATRPTDDQILQLVAQLADPSAPRRDEAQDQLRKVGRPALPLLQRAADAGDPELATRARALIKRIEAPSIPGGPLGDARFTVLKSTYNAAGRVIEASTSDRSFTVRETADEIAVSITAQEAGREVSETYRATSADELKRTEPEAFAVYDRLLRASGDVRLQLRGGGVVIVGQNPPAALLDPIDALTEKLDLQLQRLRAPADKRREILNSLAEIKPLRFAPPAESDTARDKRLKDLFEKSDALREKLDKFELDPGETLPPPARARLGIQLQAIDDNAGSDRLLVVAVVARSRAEQIGVKTGDVLLTVNGKDVHDVLELRAELVASKGPIQIEILRDEKTQVLKEKQ